jgi:UDP-2-acetamido-3-amino-2,3-dideoxy-glucuronate N-acetyltransferase
MRMESRFPGTIIHESAFIDDPVAIGGGCRIWHFVHVMAHCSVGANTVIGQNVMIGPRVRVGRNCRIQNNVSLYEGVELEDDVFCGPSCVFTNVLNPRAFISRKSEFRQTLVRCGATIGANATIICGHTIGCYALVGAGAVVTSDVADYALVVGTPARQIGWVSRVGDIMGPDLVCPSTGERYALDAAGALHPVRSRASVTGGAGIQAPGVP